MKPKITYTKINESGISNDEVDKNSDQGLVYYEAGLYQNAIETFQNDLKNKEIDLKAKAELFFKLAVTFLAIDDLKNGKKNFKKFLKIKDTSDKDQDSYEAIFLAHLGLAYSNSGKNEKAIECFKKCLNMNTSNDESSNFVMGVSFSGLAKSYYYKGKILEAQENIKRSLELLEKSKIEKELADALIVEASILFKLDVNNISESIEKCKASLEILKRLSEDKNKIIIAKAYKNLGKFYLAEGDVYNSIKHLKKAKSIMKKGLLVKHSLYSKILHHLGVAFLKNGNDLLSRKYLEQSLELCKKILPESHPVTVSVISDLENLVSTDN